MKPLETPYTNGITFFKYLSMNGYVASCSHDDKTLYIWDPNTGESIRQYTAHSETVNYLDQIDENTLVSGSKDNQIHVWQISTGQTLNKLNVGDWVYSIKSLSNGLIACGFFGGNINIYDYSTGNLTKTLIGHHYGRINSLEMLNEQLMASGAYDQNVIIWDLTSYSIKYHLTQHEFEVWYVQRLSSSLMISADKGGEIIIWNWLNGSLVHKLFSKSYNLNSLDIYDDQTLISGSSYDKKITLWNITNGHLIKSINTESGIFDVVTLNRGK